jgi:hypothetical protein
MGLNYPTYNENKEQPLMKGPFVKLTLGDLYKQTPGFFNSISIEYDDEFPWEIDKINNNDKIKLPMGASITFGFTVVADEALRNGGKQIFGLKDEWIN